MNYDYLILDHTRNKMHINPNSVLNIYNAFDYSKYIGFPLNTFITINFNSNDQFLNIYLFTQLRNNINRWIKRAYKRKKMAQSKPIWLYVFENPKHNFHVHWLIYIDCNIKTECITYLKKKLVQLQKAEIGKNQLHIQSVNPYTDKILANYLCKGIRPDYIGFFHLHNYAIDQGYVSKQRTRVAQALGRTARNKAGFSAKKMRHLWEIHHPHIAQEYEKPELWDLNEIVPQLTGSKTFPAHRAYWESCSYSYTEYKNNKPNPIKLIQLRKIPKGF